MSRKANSSSSGSGFRRGNASGGDRESGSESFARKARKRPRPLDQTGLRDLALSYVARFATTGAKLESYLARKLRERGVAEDHDGRDEQIDIPAVVLRMVELGYVDDDAYARMRSRDLAERGYGARRIEQSLWAAGVGEHVRADNALDEAGARRSAARFAQKRRLGPFANGASDEERGAIEQRRAREKAIAAMLRAGHELAHARFILDAADVSEVEEWVAEANDMSRDRNGSA